MPSIFKDLQDKLNTLIDKKSTIVRIEEEGVSETSRMGSWYSWDKKSKDLLIIIPNNPCDEDREILFGIIRKIHNMGGLLWKDSKVKVLDSYKEYIDDEDGINDKEILLFYENIIPKNDLNALKSSLFLRSESRKNKNIAGYKQDIIERFGERGNNISNLCTAGYFDVEFKNLHSSISKADFDAYYEMVVGDKARALFVNSRMTVEDLIYQVEKIVAKALRYGMPDFKIHGKGQGNVDIIDKFVAEAKKDDRYTITKSLYNIKIPVIEYTVQINR